MRSSLGLLAAVLLVALIAGCDPAWVDMPGISFRLGGPDEFPHLQVGEAVPFTAKGWYVNREDLCGSGTATIERLESVDREIITDEEWSSMFDTALASEGIAEVYLYQVFECDDGSGSFSTEAHVKYDFDTFESKGEHDIGRWEIEEGRGTGSYTGLSGRGGVALDWDEHGAWYGGEIFP